MTGLPETDSYVKDVDELLLDFSVKISDFNEALKSWKELCVEKEMAKHAKVPLVDCVINLSEACSFQLESRPITDGFGLEEISWPRLERTAVFTAEPGGKTRRQSSIPSALVKSSEHLGQEGELDSDEGEEAARDVVVHFQTRVSPAAATLQATTVHHEERLKKIADCMTFSLKRQMELASDNGEQWTIEKKKKQNSNLSRTPGMTEMEKLILRNRKNCKIIADGLKLMLSTREKLSNINKKLKAALI